jgi:hypothetical protein
MTAPAGARQPLIFKMNAHHVRACELRGGQMFEAAE